MASTGPSRSSPGGEVVGCSVGQDEPVPMENAEWPLELMIRIGVNFTLPPTPLQASSSPAAAAAAGQEEAEFFHFDMFRYRVHSDPAETRACLPNMLEMVLEGLLVRPEYPGWATAFDLILDGIGIAAATLPAEGSHFVPFHALVDVVVDELPQENDGEEVPASKEAIEGLEKIRVRVSAEECAICLDDITVGSEATRLPCSYLFHGDCIVKWLGTKSDCPSCRSKLS